MAVFNFELFEYIERRGPISVAEFVEKFGIPKRSAATELSRWCNYKNVLRGITQHFLVYVPSGSRGPGRYKLGPDWWGERYFDSAKVPGETYHDDHRVDANARIADAEAKVVKAKESYDKARRRLLNARSRLSTCVERSKDLRFY